MIGVIMSYIIIIIDIIISADVIAAAAAAVCCVRLVAVTSRMTMLCRCSI